MRSKVRLAGLYLLPILLLLSSSPSAFAGGGSNTYDKFRNAKYSNDGLMSVQDELRLGQQVHDQILAKYAIVRDPEINAYLQQLGERLVHSSKRQDIQYRFFAIQDNSVNAFAIPGGYVYVHTGLLNLVQSEDELAGAMAHEIGHVVARHGLKNVKKAQRVSLISGIIGIGTEIATHGSGAGRAAQQASQILGAGILTKNSRDFEREADYLGLYDMTAAGYDPNAMTSLFKRLQQAGSSSKSGMGGIFASHPNAAERTENTQNEISGRLGRSGSTNSVATASSGRARRASQQSSDFVAMKRALGSYGSGSYGSYRRSNGQQRPQPADQEPVRNDRPVLTRRP